jgi:hypothetical protein
MARRKSKLNSEECKQAIAKFFQKQKRFKQIQSQFGEMKAEFYNDMEDYFMCNNIDGKLTFECDNLVDAESFVVTRIQSSKVEFNPDKLEKALGKELARDVVLKHYEIIDMNGLVTYLKECGISPKVFKSFISVRKTVNTKELDRLEELGKITAEQIKGCYTIKSQNPYFTVNIGKGQDE